MNAVVAMSPDAVAIAEREHMVWVARHAAPPSGSPFLADTSTELLRTIAEVLDIRSVFPRVSEIVKQVLPHDALALKFSDRAGHMTLEARSTEDLPEDGWCTSPDDKDFFIVSDFRRLRSPLAAHEPDVVDALLAAGYRSALSVRGVAQHQVMRLGFFSKQANAYSSADVPAAQHVADYVVVAVAHEQLAAAERDRAEARARSERVDARVRALADKGEVLQAHGRMIGRSHAWQRVL